MMKLLALAGVIASANAAKHSVDDVAKLNDCAKTCIAAKLGEEFEGITSTKGLCLKELAGLESSAGTEDAKAQKYCVDNLENDKPSRHARDSHVLKGSCAELCGQEFCAFGFATDGVTCADPPASGSGSSGSSSSSGSAEETKSRDRRESRDRRGAHLKSFCACADIKQYQRTEIMIDNDLAEKMDGLCKKTDGRKRRLGHAKGKVDLSCEAGKKAAKEFGDAYFAASGSSFTMANVKDLKISYVQNTRRERRGKHIVKSYVDITFKSTVTKAALTADAKTVSDNTPFDVTLPAGSAIAGTWATPKQTIATGEVKGFEKRTSGAATAVATAAAALSVFAMAL